MIKGRKEKPVRTGLIDQVKNMGWVVGTKLGGGGVLGGGSGVESRVRRYCGRIRRERKGNKKVHQVGQIGSYGDESES